MLDRLYNFFRMRRAGAKALAAEDAFLSEVKGVIHIGAHRGAERHLYGALGLDVIWIEADPKMYAELTRNLSGYPRQRAVQALVADTDGQEVAFNVSSNRGASSSMLAFKEHADLWPGVTMVEQRQLLTRRFETIVREEKIDLSLYDALVLDVQGAEMLVLDGIGDLIREFRILKLEAADFEAYDGGTRVDALAAYVSARGFKERARIPFGGMTSDRKYYDLIVERV